MASAKSRRFRIIDILTLCRYNDLTMLSMCNALERSAEDWDNLIRSVDARYKLSRIIQPPFANQGIIEIVWCGT